MNKEQKPQVSGFTVGFFVPADGSDPVVTVAGFPVPSVLSLPGSQGAPFQLALDPQKYASFLGWLENVAESPFLPARVLPSLTDLRSSSGHARGKDGAEEVRRAAAAWSAALPAAAERAAAAAAVPLALAQALQGEKGMEEHVAACELLAGEVYGDLIGFKSPDRHSVKACSRILAAWGRPNSEEATYARSITSEQMLLSAQGETWKQGIALARLAARLPRPQGMPEALNISEDSSQMEGKQ